MGDIIYMLLMTTMVMMIMIIIIANNNILVKTKSRIQLWLFHYRILLRVPSSVPKKLWHSIRNVIPIKRGAYSVIYCA